MSNHQEYKQRCHHQQEKQIEKLIWQLRVKEANESGINNLYYTNTDTQLVFSTLEHDYRWGQ